jgi:hypothetical protein
MALNNGTAINKTKTSAAGIRKTIGSHSLRTLLMRGVSRWIVKLAIYISPDSAIHTPAELAIVSNEVGLRFHVDNEYKQVAVSQRSGLNLLRA